MQAKTARAANEKNDIGQKGRRDSCDTYRQQRVSSIPSLSKPGEDGSCLTPTSLTWEVSFSTSGRSPLSVEFDQRKAGQGERRDGSRETKGVLELPALFAHCPMPLPLLSTLREPK